MNYNDKFVANFDLSIAVKRYRENIVAADYELWALSNKIRMKRRVTLENVTVYFEDAEDLLVFKLKFGV